MKKILLALIFLLVISLAGCDSPAIDYASQDDYEALEERVSELETYLDQLVVTTGLNGQVDYYINSDGKVYVSRMGFEMIAKEKDYLDKSKFPDYIWDIDDNYISVNDLGNLLSQKYLGVESETITGFQYKMQLEKPIDMTDDEFMVRLCMMVLELAEYDFYTIDSPELYIEFVSGGSEYMKVRMSLLVTDKYNLHPAIFWNEMLDTRIEGIEFDTELSQGYYDEFILNETFDGYVLDYN